MPIPDFHPIAPGGEVDLVVQYPEQLATRLDGIFKCIPTPSGLGFRRSAVQSALCSAPREQIIWKSTWKPKTLVSAEVSSEAELTNDLPKPDTEMEASAISEEEKASISSENCVRIRVSSKHLILASSYFKRNLESGMSESHVLNSEGRVNIPMKDWDPEATLIVMNIIHGRTRKVPRRVDFDLLTKIAILVDYLDCHEAIEPFSDMWIQSLNESVTYTYSKELVQWLCVSDIFQKERMFRDLTYEAIRQAKGPIETLGLPIRESLVEALNLHRNYALDQLFSAFEQLLDYFRQDIADCAFECNAVRYGALTKELSGRGLLFPRPQIPFLGYSVENITASIRDIQDPHWGNKSKGSNYGSSHGSTVKYHSCQLRLFIEPIIQFVGSNLRGLSLSDFTKAE